MKVEGFASIKRRLIQSAARFMDSPNQVKGAVIVGYTAQYAVRVHEDKEMQDRREARGGNGQWKYLEKPARQLNDDGTLGKLVAETVKAGRTIEDGLVIAGLRIQRESQKLVPVDTGNLKGSAFTKKE